MTYAIELKQVSREFHDTEAVRNVSATLPFGKIYGLIGRNGAGKSTLLSLLASYDRPSRGEIFINGEKPYENAAIMPNVMCAYPATFEDETRKVKQVLETEGRYRETFDVAYAFRLAEQFGLPLNRKAVKLSKGMKAVLSAILGLASRCRVTIFDEIYSGMDAPTRELFYEALLEDHAAFPRTIILSTHLVSEMAYLFEDVLILHQGKLLFHKSVEEISEEAFSVTGSKQQLVELGSDAPVLVTKELGEMQSAVIFSTGAERLRKQADALELMVEEVQLQELFIALTKEGERYA